jgi:hypothetical protein
MFRLSSDAVATKQEVHRSPRADLEGRRRAQDPARPCLVMQSGEPRREKMSVAVADNADGVQVSVPLEAEPKLITKNGLSGETLLNTVSVSSQLRIDWG